MTTSSIINQYSLIILRDEKEDALPGAPTSLSPLTYEPGLAPGEPNFTPDTGRFFIGHDPSVGQKNFRRTSFPYQNIEVVTENSTELFGDMAAGYLKEGDDRSFYKTVLSPAASYTPVTIPVQGDPAYVYRINNPQSLAAFVDYAAFDTDQKPVRMGRLRIMQAAGNATPFCADDGVNMSAALLSFSASETGPVGGRYVVINYRYTGTANFSLSFRLTRPTA